MHYIVQENMFREENYNNLINVLDNGDFSYEIVKVLPFIEDFNFESKDKNIFVFGSVKMARLGVKYGWYPGSLLNENHDYRVYSKFYKENLLNYDSIVQKFSDNIKFKEEFFVRPCEDNKVFTGKVFNKDTWSKFAKESLSNGHSTTLSKDTEIQVAKVKNIKKEFRFWIVDGKIVTGSLYKMNDWVYSSEIVDEGAYLFCGKMVEIFQLADAFVMDVCETDDGYKIVECGCINCAGFYKANMEKLILSLEDKFNQK